MMPEKLAAPSVQAKALKVIGMMSLVYQLIMIIRTYIHECFLHEVHVESVWWPLQYMADAVMHTREECTIAQQTMMTTVSTMLTTLAVAWGVAKG